MSSKNHSKRAKRRPNAHRGEQKTPSYPTKSWGPSAQSELVRRIPVFGTPWKRVKIPYYAYQQNQTGVGGALSNKFFTCNGVFDPDITGSGHQPLGFDTMMLYYEQYTVMRSKITVCFANRGVDTLRVAVSLTPDTTTPVIGTLVENGEIRMKICDAPGGTGSIGNGGPVCGRIAIIDLSCDVASYFGRKGHREMLDDSTLQGNASANPTEQVYYAISAWGGLDASATSVTYDVVLEYDVVFWEPRKLSEQLEKNFHAMVSKEARIKAFMDTEAKTK